jgi:2-keto-4-pentenoate hydratase
MNTVKEAAYFIANLRFNLEQTPAIPEAFRPRDPQEGYQVQKHMVEQLLAKYGGTRIGYKVACTNKLAQKLLHLNAPFYGCLLSSRVHTSPVHLNAGDFSMRVIEAEFAFEMGMDLPGKGTPYQKAEVAEAVSAIMPAIEIVDTRYTDWTSVGAPSLIADNGCNGAWAKGATYGEWKALDLETHEVVLMVNGEEKLKGTGSAVLDHPLNSLTWMANMLVEQGSTLKAGDLISTGVVTDLYHAEPGDKIIADFGTIGKVELFFDSE